MPRSATKHETRVECVKMGTNVRTLHQDKARLEEGVYAVEHERDWKDELMELKVKNVQCMGARPFIRDRIERKTGDLCGRGRVRARLHHRGRSRDVGSRPVEAKRLSSAAGRACTRHQDGEYRHRQLFGNKYHRYAHEMRSGGIPNQLTARCSPLRGLHRLQDGAFDACG
ncbi:hypothetical protein BDV93DRAFT_523567 [Ceratobasidium sp. AG-I]|nr:hypothetical protein BDV93DRAFT_523567 [Ceratobasidium sp. AG-I]